MEYRRIGDSGLKVSKICMGCMSFGGAGGPTHPWANGGRRGPALSFAVPWKPGSPSSIPPIAYKIHRCQRRGHGSCAEKKFARRDEVVIASKVGP